MAKLYFYYSAMNAGKTTALLQSGHNYKERGMNVVYYTPKADSRFGVGQIQSRIGIHAPATIISETENLFTKTRDIHLQQPLHCVLVDEAQFLTKSQIKALGDVADQLQIPVLAYGLRTDYRGELFEGSQYLLAWADNLIELKTICHCGSKATMTVRLDANGNPLFKGRSIHIAQDNEYVSVCRKHYNAMRAKASLGESSLETT